MGLSVAAAPGAGAAVAATTHALPSHGAAGVTFLCGPDPRYACTPGYTGTNAPTAAWSVYGCPNASGCPTTPHNCTLYAAYKLAQMGIVPNWSADAGGWDTKASGQGVRVDQTPAPGAIAQWNQFKGHVAYVEAFDATSITLTMDWWSSAAQTPSWPGGYTSRVRIAADSPAWPDNFVHFADVAANYTVLYSSTDLASLRGAADYFGIPRRDATKTGAQLLVFLDVLNRPGGLGPLTPLPPSRGPGGQTATYATRAEVDQLKSVARRGGVTVRELHDLGAHLLIYLWLVSTHGSS